MNISKILKKSVSKFIQLSFAQPHFRTKYLMALHINNIIELEITETVIKEKVTIKTVKTDTEIEIETTNMNSDITPIITPTTPLMDYCARYAWTLSYSSIDTEIGCLNSFLYVMKL